jgi:hypothetical protein
VAEREQGLHLVREMLPGGVVVEPGLGLGLQRRWKRHPAGARPRALARGCVGVARAPTDRLVFGGGLPLWRAAGSQARPGALLARVGARIVRGSANGRQFRITWSGPGGSLVDGARRPDHPESRKTPALAGVPWRVSDGTRTRDRLDHNRSEGVAPSREVAFLCGFCWSVLRPVVLRLVPDWCPLLGERAIDLLALVR